MLLPDEILNLIFSFRERNPISLLIRRSINDYKNSIFDSYYKHTLMRFQEKRYINGIQKIENFYECKSNNIKTKKNLSKKNKMEKEKKNYIQFNIDCEKYIINYKNFFHGVNHTYHA